MTGPRLTGNRCQCAACGLHFTSAREFDRHRIGRYAELGQWQGARRCLTVAELQARGWRTNERGFWMQPRLERAPADPQGPCVTLPARVVPGEVQAATLCSGRTRGARVAADTEPRADRKSVREGKRGSRRV